MSQDLRDQRRIFNTGNDSKLAAALGTGLDVDGEYPVKASEVQSRAWDQCGQAGNEVQRIQHDMGRTIAEGVFVAVNDPAPAINTEAFGRNRRQVSIVLI